MAENTKTNFKVIFKGDTFHLVPLERGKTTKFVVHYAVFKREGAKDKWVEVHFSKKALNQIIRLDTEDKFDKVSCDLKVNFGGVPEECKKYINKEGKEVVEDIIIITDVESVIFPTPKPTTSASDYFTSDSKLDDNLPF